MDSVILQEHFELAQRHVASATRIVNTQRRLIERLESWGQDTQAARLLLAEYQQTLRLYLADCERLARQLTREVRSV
jgi:hypothetical protein